jgi:hypothetical protein
MTTEAMKMALEALTRIWEDGLENFPESEHDAAITALRTAIAEAEKQEPVAWMVIGDGEYGEYTPGTHFDTVGYKEYWERRGYELQPLYTTPPAAPDLQAELEATNRQVEILSDALSESQREVAALKAVQEPVAWIFKPNRELLWPNEVERKNPLELNEYAPLYTTPLAQRQWVGLTDEEVREIHRLSFGKDVAISTGLTEAKLRSKNT